MCINSVLMYIYVYFLSYVHIIIIILFQDVCSDGVKCTPLIAAARHGREAAVRILLEKFRPPVRLETEGTVKFDEYVIEGLYILKLLFNYCLLQTSEIFNDVGFISIQINKCILTVIIKVLTIFPSYN